MERTQLIKQMEQERLWNKTDALLLAVSGGVDSMVLLDVLLHAPECYQKLGVVHVDHQLRTESKIEQQFLKQLCAQYHIEFYSAVWTPTRSNIESNARAFRYAFFEETAMRYDYDCILTAHHLNDQAETMLMKFIREGQLFSAKSLVAKRTLGEKQLIRPLLSVTKTQIYDYAKRYEITYYEDQSNHTDHYTRNRVRKYIIPQLIKENTQALPHLNRVGKQIDLAEQLIFEEYIVWSKQCIVKTDTKWCVDLLELATLSIAKQYYFWQCLRLDIASQITISQTQIEELMLLLKKDKGQWQLDLTKGAQIKRRYDQLWIIIEEKNLVYEKNHEEERIHLVVNQSYQLSETEKIGIFSPDQLPEWSADFNCLISNRNEYILRKRQSGDRIQLTPTLTKQLRRFLIDNKIPLEERKQAWVLEDKDKNLLAFLPFVCSYLSIGKETDKIHYVLLYKYKK